jgi:aquaporin NIP
MYKLVAEAVGTFILIFAGCGVVMVNDLTGGMITIVGIALVWGLTVSAMIYAVGESSGAHINPAVTIAFAAAGRFS